MVLEKNLSKQNFFLKNWIQREWIWFNLVDIISLSLLQCSQLIQLKNGPKLDIEVLFLFITCYSKWIFCSVTDCTISRPTLINTTVAVHQYDQNKNDFWVFVESHDTRFYGHGINLRLDNWSFSQFKLCLLWLINLYLSWIIFKNF